MKYEFFFPSKVATLVVVNKLGKVAINNKYYGKGIHKIPLESVDNLVSIETDKTLNNCDVCGLTSTEKVTYPKYRICV